MCSLCCAFALLSLPLPLAVSFVSWFDSISASLSCGQCPYLSFESIFHLYRFSPPLPSADDILHTRYKTKAVLSTSPSQVSSLYQCHRHHHHRDDEATVHRNRPAKGISGAGWCVRLTPLYKLWLFWYLYFSNELQHTSWIVPYAASMQWCVSSI